MTKALVAAVFFLLVSCAAVAEMHDETLTVTGPCYDPATLQEKLNRNGFWLRVSGQSENSAGTKASVLFYRKDREFVIVMRHHNLACVLVAGRKLDRA